MLAKAAGRVALAFQALLGRLDHVHVLAEEVHRLQAVEETLRRSLAIETRQKTYWCDLWLATGLGHQRAQELMVAEIDKIAGVGMKLLEELKVARKRARMKAPDEWADLLARYDGASWIDMMEKFRESFVNTKHPVDIDTSIVRKEAPTQ